jgi:hypothetical protein
MFLVVLYYFTTTRHRRYAVGRVRSDNVTAGPALYEARRRTMAMCNLIAFIVFTSWPCMPPRLLSDPEYKGPDAEESKSFGFVDTVHSGTGESSVWTTNKFCNQYGKWNSQIHKATMLTHSQLPCPRCTSVTLSSSVLQSLPSPSPACDHTH